MPEKKLSIATWLEKDPIKAKFFKIEVSESELAGLELLFHFTFRILAMVAFLLGSIRHSSKSYFL